MAAKEIAIIGASWPDISVECEVVERDNAAAGDIAPLLEDVGVAP